VSERESGVESSLVVASARETSPTGRAKGLLDTVADGEGEFLYVESVFEFPTK
jgi:hypothetical protein